MAQRSRSSRREYRQNLRRRWPCGKQVWSAMSGEYPVEQVSGPTMRRWRVWIRQDKRCAYCRKPLQWYRKASSPKWDIHHIILRNCGGTNRYDNLQATCVECHREIHRRDSSSRAAMHQTRNAFLRRAT